MFSAVLLPLGPSSPVGTWWSLGGVLPLPASSVVVLFVGPVRRRGRRMAFLLVSLPSLADIVFLGFFNVSSSHLDFSGLGLSNGCLWAPFPLRLRALRGSFRRLLGWHEYFSVVCQILMFRWVWFVVSCPSIPYPMACLDHSGVWPALSSLPVPMQYMLPLCSLFPCRD